MHSRRPSKPGSVRRHRKKSKVVAPDAGIDDPVLMNVYREFDAELVPKEKVKYEAEMRRLVEKFAKRKNKDEMDSFFLVDLSAVARRALKWQRNLPGVRLYYAVKCNPNIGVLRVLDALNCGFDCASKEEIDVVTSLFREEKRKDLERAGVEMASQDFEQELLEEAADRIIYANPCKLPSHMRFARERGVKMTTVDNIEELHKIAEHWPEAHVVIRIRTDDKNSEHQFSTKFGCSLRHAREIIREGKRLGLTLIGVSFHVGSGCRDSSSYLTALEHARRVFDWAKEIGGYDFTLVDIGGGWPGLKNAKPSFEELAADIRPTLEKLFPSDRTTIIGEPGRFIVTPSHTLLVNVYAKRDCRAFDDEEEERDFADYDEAQKEDLETKEYLKNSMDDFLLYVNDGVYGSLNNIIFDHYTPKIKTLKKAKEKKILFKTTVFGQTCDSIDVIAKGVQLPEMSIGDWLWMQDLGAYTTAASTHFNGFRSGDLQYIWRI